MALFLPSNINQLQGDEIFSVQSGGQQCAFMSLSALSFRFVVLLFCPTTQAISAISKTRSGEHHLRSTEHHFTEQQKNLSPL